MFVILILGLLSFVAFGIVKIQPDFFAPATFFIDGFGGFYNNSGFIVFLAVGGAYIITDFAPTIKNASKVMVKIIFIVTIGVCCIYMLLGAVASGAVPLKDAAFKTLPLRLKRCSRILFYMRFLLSAGRWAL
jgi:APA family basic amino acid/polyamine antiporter